MPDALEFEHLKAKLSELSIRVSEMESRERVREGELKSIMGRLGELERR